MTEKIRAVLAKPGELASEIELENSYPAIRDTVGGIITQWNGLGIPGTVGYVHDEGLLIGLPWNRCYKTAKQYLAGNILVVGTDTEGNDISLTDEQVKLVLYGLNRIMSLMEPTPSSIDELERLTGEPAVQVFFDDEPAAAFAAVRAGLAGATWEPRKAPSETGWQTGAASAVINGWTVLVVAFRPQGEPAWRADGTITRGPLVIHMDRNIAIECAMHAGLMG
jgi:hypothetical protein